MHAVRTPLVTMLLAGSALLPGLARAQSPTPPMDTLAAATADRSAMGCPPMRFSQLQRRVIVEADRSAEALRRYLSRTRMIHQLDYTETALWVDQVRQRNLDCRSTITAAAP